MVYQSTPVQVYARSHTGEYGHSQEISLDKLLVPYQYSKDGSYRRRDALPARLAGKCTAEEEGRKGACDDFSCNDSKNGHQTVRVKACQLLAIFEWMFQGVKGSSLGILAKFQWFSLGISPGALAKRCCTDLPILVLTRETG
jgi:hypothetical protein